MDIRKDKIETKIDRKKMEVLTVNLKHDLRRGQFTKSDFN